MRRKLITSTLAGMILLALMLSSGPASVWAGSIELTYSIFFPATHGHTILATEWSKEVEKRTNGAVKISLFPGAALTPADQCYDGVVNGIADIGMSVLSYVKGRFPLTEVIDLPLGYTNGKQATRLTNAYYQKFQPKELSDVKVMYLHAHGPGILHTKKPVEKLEDLKGLKIRCTGTSSKVVAALGGTPVAMPMNETYDALQKGVVDGLLAPIETLKGWKFAEVIKSTTNNYGSSYSVAFFVVMNQKKWESLPKDVQKTIEEINKEWIEKTGEVWDSLEKAGLDYTQSKGNKVISLSKEEDERWAQLVKPVLDDYLKASKAKNLPGEEALKFCQEWLKANP
ncbi:MAG: TRAP transporter substrate-binding protein [Deltaproteobacteria bacterium]|nr:TRAP transporter substrate-binding protein [Deltaproteobacteria bacterium]